MLVACGALVLWFTLAAFMNRPARPAGKAVELVVISPHWEGIKYEFANAFEARWNREHPEQAVRIVWRDVGGTSQIVRVLENDYEKTPGGVGIDILFGGGTTPYEKLKELGILERVALPADVLERLPKEVAGVPLYDSEWCYFGAAISGFGIVYNRKVLEFLRLPAPRTWQDMANSRYIDWVASGDPTKSGSVHMLYEIILQAYGFERGYATMCAIAGNVRAFDEGGNATPRAVGLGDAALGGAIDFYAWEQVDAFGRECVDFILPSGLTVVNADPIAVLKGAPHRDIAGAFILFVLSEAGQKLWYLKKGAPGGPTLYGLNRLPVLKELYGLGLPTAVAGNPFEFRAGFRYDPQKGSLRWRITNDLFKATIMDVHAALRAAWRIVGPSGDARLLAEFGRPPVSEERLLELAAGPWNSASARAEYMAEWTRFAHAKFERLVAGAWQ